MDGVLEKEQIEKNKIWDVRVMIFPCFIEPNSTSGILNEDLSQISIYPLFSCQDSSEIPSCLSDFDNEDLIFIITTRGVHTLIHEILHLKYENEEEIEKKATEYVAYLCKFLEYF